MRVGRTRVRERPTIQRLRELLKYDPLTGEFRWAVDRGGCKNAKAGDLAGTVRPDGYVVISIDGSPCLAHRIAVAMTEGAWPDLLVDHRDTNPSNNKLGNLRKATGLQSSANRRTPSTNTSGIRGVRQRKGRYLAQMKLNGECKFLGSYPTAEEAKTAYDDAYRSAHEDFARVE